MELATLGLFAAALFVNAGSPGPSVAALVARVISSGVGSVLPFMLAFWVGEAIWLTAAVLGLGLVLERFGTVLGVIKIAGVIYLCWLAWKMWHAPVADASADLPRGSASRMFLAGLAITLGNPKIMVFYLALLPTLIDIPAITALGFAELLAVAIAVTVIVDLAWAVAAMRARGFLRSPRARRIANRLGAGTMGGAALVIAVRD